MTEVWCQVTSKLHLYTLTKEIDKPFETWSNGRADAHFCVYYAAVHKVMEVMRTANAKSGTRSLTRLKLQTKQAIMEGTWVLWKEGAHRLRTPFYVAESFGKPGGKGAFEIRHSFLYISFCWYALPNFCTQISRPLAYGVCISSKASSAAVGDWNISGISGPCKYVKCAWKPWSDWSATCGHVTRTRSSGATEHVTNRPSCDGLQTTCPRPEVQKKTTNCKLLGCFDVYLYFIIAL